MASENAQMVREIYRGWAQGDFSAGIEYFDPGIEFVSEFGPDRVTVKGMDGMSRAWADQLRNWEEWRAGEIQELRDMGDTILVLSAVRGRGRRSGAEVEMSDAAAVFRFREGRIVYLLATIRMDVARAEAGLEE